MTSQVISMRELPDADFWREAAARHSELFDPIDAGARIAFIRRDAPSSMLVWKTLAGRVDASVEAFSGYSQCGADMVLAANVDALEAIGRASQDALFETLRDGIRRGSIVCFMLRRRCDLEARGFDELLDALGFAFMGACR